MNQWPANPRSLWESDLQREEGRPASGWKEPHAEGRVSLNSFRIGNWTLTGPGVWHCWEQGAEMLGRDRCELPTWRSAELITCLMSLLFIVSQNVTARGDLRDHLIQSLCRVDKGMEISMLSRALDQPRVAQRRPEQLEHSSLDSPPPLLLAIPAWAVQRCQPVTPN